MVYVFDLFMQDNIAKVVPDSNPSRFIALSKTGQIHMLTSDLCISKQLHMEESTDGGLEELPKKRRTKLWVTDCICLKELNKLVVATASRDLQFFDLSSSHCSQQFQLYGKLVFNYKYFCYITTTIDYFSWYILVCYKSFLSLSLSF